MRRLLADALVALGLVGIFVAIAGIFGPRWQPKPSPTQVVVTTATSDYIGTWDCDTLTLSLTITGEAQRLSVTGLDSTPVIFVRDNTKQPFREEAGQRSLLVYLKHLTLTLNDGRQYGFSLRQ